MNPFLKGFGKRSGRVRIINSTKQTTVACAVESAASLGARLVGLLGRRQLEAGGGLLITPSSGVHTWGMRFRIDVVALDSRMCVVQVRENLGAFRIAAVSWRTRSVLELPVGAVRQSRIEVGDQLALLAA